MPEMKQVIINNKWPILLPEHRAARPEWYTAKGWERKRLDHMRLTTKENDLVFYVGAEEGEMCALLQKWGAEVVMIEPNPLVWPNIKLIWEANKLAPPSMTFQGFASSKSDDYHSAVTSFGFPKSADGEITAEHGFKNLCEADGTIRQAKLDDLAREFNLIPDMISIDVEGAEWEVLRGAEKILKEHHPKIYLSLHPEFLYEIYKEYAADLRYWLKQLGYNEKFLDYEHELHLFYWSPNKRVAEASK